MADKSKILSRFSEAKGNVEFRSQEEFLKSLAESLVSDRSGDLNTPYSFREWEELNTGIIPGQEYQQYNAYLKGWYKTRFTSTTAKNSIKEDYINLLKQISIAFRDEVDSEFIKDINFSDVVELEESIPFFARKLKEIAIYLINKREAIQRAKLKYNTSGANQALERLFYEYLLKAFTKQDYALNVPEYSTYTSFPDLSAINTNFQIIVDELYDDTSYFDKDPTMPVSAYFDISSANVTAYFDSLNFPSSALEWVFSTGFAELCANNPLIWTLTQTLCTYGATNISEIPVSAFDDITRNRLNDFYKIDLNEKYLGTKQYIMSGGYYVLPENEYEINLQRGNNWFYWLSGEHFIEAPFEHEVDDIPLSATNLIESGAIAGKNYKDADKIFVTRNDSLSGAWLRSVVRETASQLMCASLTEESPYHFRFPFPGYGISGEDFSWTGKQLTNLTTEFNFLEDAFRAAVKDAYWSTMTDTSAICSVGIHDTTLIDNGAYANAIYLNADKLSVRKGTNTDRIHDLNPDEVYKDDFEHAWLHSINKTDIPIRANTQENIYWPTQRIKGNETISYIVPSSQCSNVSLSSINPSDTMIGSRAGMALYDSDIIYKLDGEGGAAVEAAWLSGRMFFNNLPATTFTQGSTGTLQPALTLRCRPGEPETFMWAGTASSITPIDINGTTIVHKPHQPNCNYLDLDLISLFKERPSQDKGLDYEQWKQCNCGAVYYSPIGHPGNIYDDFHQMADIIFVDYSYPEPFGLTTWRDSEGKDYKSSTEFAWYKLGSSRVEPDVGYSIGSWVNYSGTNTLRLSAGVQYKYIRSKLDRNLDDGNSSVAPFIIKQPYFNTHATWSKANLLSDGSWSTTSSATDMILRPGDHLLYDHIDSNWYCVTSENDKGNTVSYDTSAYNTVLDNHWSTYTVVTTGTVIEYEWPDLVYTDGPSIIASELSSISWGLTSPQGNMFDVLAEPADGFRFKADELYTGRTHGVFTVHATGYSETKGEIRMDHTNSMSNVTAYTLMPTRGVSGSDSVNTVYADTTNMIINISLSGWDSNTSTFNGISAGARPIWMAASDEPNLETKSKGAHRWGGGVRIVDDYSLISQPEFSNIELTLDDYVIYEHTGSRMTWQQPIIIKVDEESKQWCSLILDPYATHPLSAHIFNIDNDFAVSATEAQSNIILTIGSEDDLMFINYYAQNRFTWTQLLTNSVLGFPPTGGVFIPVVNSELIDPIVPYANLTNRHYPTIATIPYVENLYTEADVGGYFIPRHLGVTTYITKDKVNVINPAAIPNIPEDRGLLAVYQDPDNFITDIGHTNTDQVTPVSNVFIDAQWAKSGPISDFKNGVVANTKDYQTFIGYQSKYESTNNNNSGIIRQKEKYDPWTGPTDDTWEDEINFPSNFRGEFNISGWYEQFFI